MNNIPRDWQIKKLKDTTQRIIVGLATSVTKYYRYKGIPIIRNLNIRDGYFDSHSILYLDEEFANKEHRKSVNYNDILVVHTGVNLGLACLVPLDFHGAQTFTTLIITTKSQELFPSYLMYYINSENGKSEIERLQVGAGKNNLNVKDFNNFIILIPPLSEQKKIASILSTIDNLIQNIDYLINSYTLLKKGLMQTLLTKGIRHTEFKKTQCGEIPKEWNIKKIKDVVNISIGGTPSRNRPELWDKNKENNNIWVSIKDLSSVFKYISDSSEYISDLGVNSSNAKLVKKDTVLMSFKLTIGKTAITKRDLYTNEAIASFEILNKNVLDLNYLYYKLPFLSYDLDQAIKGQTLNKEKINNTFIPIPSFDEQQKISEILSIVDDQVFLFNNKKENFKLLKKGIMQQLLTGKIRVKV